MEGGVAKLLASAPLQRAATATFLSTLDLLARTYPGRKYTGVCLDFEPTSAFTAKQFTTFVAWTRTLGNALAAKGYQLSLCTNAIDPASKAIFKNSAFVDHPLSRLIYMCYDYQYDEACGLTPPAKLRQALAWAQTDLGASFAAKAVIGLPSYGFSKDTGGGVAILTRQQVAAALQKDAKTAGAAIPDVPTSVVDYATSTDPYGYEGNWTLSDGTQIVAATTASLDAECALAAAAGASRVCVWHLGGGNPLPSFI